MGLIRLLFLLVILFVSHFSCNLMIEKNFDFECSEKEPFPDKQVPLEIINMDMDPHLRWINVSSKYKNELKTMYAHITNLVGPTIFYMLSKSVKLIKSRLDNDLLEEMKGVSEGSGIEIDDVILFNIFYEYFTVCTSIIAVDANGIVHHARNMDFGLFIGWDPTNSTWKLPGLLRPLTARINFVKNGVSLVQSVNFIGYIGILTGISSKGFSLTLNERFQLNGGYIGLVELILGLSNGKFAGFLLREVLFNAQNFEEAKKLLTETELLAPAYYILADSKDKGCVITRDRERTTDVWEINLDQGVWYLLQTNYDRTTKPPFFDDRNTPGNFCMQKIPRENINELSLFNVLKTRPLRNQLTVYVALMVPSTGALTSYLQYCPPPCPLW